MHIVKKGIIRQMIVSAANEMPLQVNVNVDGTRQSPTLEAPLRSPTLIRFDVRLTLILELDVARCVPRRIERPIAVSCGRAVRDRPCAGDYIHLTQRCAAAVKKGM